MQMTLFPSSFKYLTKLLFDIVLTSNKTQKRTLQRLGHSSVGQTWDYIKNVVDATERRNQLKGGNLLFATVKPLEEPNNVVDADWTQVIAK